MPANWDFLKRPVTSLKGSPSWIAPSPDYEVKPSGSIIRYDFCFCSYCNKVQVNFAISTTSFISVMVNGVWTSSHAPNGPFGQSILIKIPASIVKCGCENYVTIYGYNFGFPSPMALAYSIYQSCKSAMNCPNLGVTYYNF